MSRPLHLMFVCTANISRSPYAERRALQVLAGHPIEVSSAGMPGYPGRGMDPEMVAPLVERGGDARAHVSRSLSRGLLDAADLVLVFEFAQHMRVFDAYPDARMKVLGLGQLARAASRLDDVPIGRPARAVIDPGCLVDDLVDRVTQATGMNSMSYDIADPHGRGWRTALACANTIDAALDAALPLLAGTPLPTLAAPASEASRRRWWRLAE